MVKWVLIFIILLVIVFLFKEVYFSSICLFNAITDKRNGVTKHNYLKWEMPNNDIENEINDEIKINILYICSCVLMMLNSALFSKYLLPINVIFVIFTILYFKSNKLNERYCNFYYTFCSKKDRSEFSNDLVNYGLRIEGTITKLFYSKILALCSVVLSTLAMIIK